MLDANKSKALERINELFVQAEDNFNEYPQMSTRYVQLARKIAMRYRVKFTKAQKLCFCKKCNSYLKKGINSTIRIKNNNIVLSCKECGFVKRFKYK